jgi:hypothetical protein
MNWRRGLFRRWIVSAALFVIAVASIGYSDIKAQFERPVREEVFVPVLCGQARGAAGTDYAVKEKGKPGPWDAYRERVVETCWYTLPKLRPLYPEYNDLSDEELVRKLYASRGLLTFWDLIPAPAPWATVGMWAGIAFGIPLVVLVLGASLVWAFSGFAATTRPN